ncbi:methylamine methyltransferase corrinoid protein reductive activase [Methanobrevibacter sp. DSM 116169]|uniref:methylamine methyltransferase corrinoid protein reductive activase n=1 Tax=Methanobrevibacter sp. DSM 116169 TaxID=3242727 RepID=UPI0038FCB027
MYGIAIDIGTSGIRAQALDINKNEVISTVITLKHPLPGANVVDHLHFALKVGLDVAHNLLITDINKVIEGLNIDLSKVIRVAVCGNPIQLSLFHNIEIRDLAYWGDDVMERMNITPPSRNSTITSPDKIGLNLNKDAQILIPPAIKHEIGADALAMLYKSGVLNKDGIFLVIDFGTNAEIALVIDGEIFACSAAAGPAIEGQNIKYGRLASPGVISDLEEVGLDWKNLVLNNDLKVVDGDIIDPMDGNVSKNANLDFEIKGITGTGVIATFSLGQDGGIIEDSKIETDDGLIHLQGDISISPDDISNIGKALGAFRAAFLTLAEDSGILLEDIDAVYMAGASGFYVDPLKSINVGQIPPTSKNIYQVGNTSLDMAQDIVFNPKLLDTLQDIANSMRSNHIMLALSDTFEKIYSLELALYDQNMPFWKYNEWLQKYGFQTVPEAETDPNVERLFERDIEDLGFNGLSVIDIGATFETSFDGCTGCLTCINECPENAISYDDGKITLRTDRCLGLGCQKCVLSCPEKVFDYNKFFKK